MSVASLISSGYLTIGANNTFSPAGNAKIIAALENLYSRSSNARSLIDSLAGGPEVLDISFKQNDAEADVGLFRIRIDPDSQYLYIAPNGSALSDSLESVLLHEIYHAVNGIRDVIVTIDGSAPREPDEYRGQTVIATNSAMDQYFSSVGGYEDRLTYSAFIRIGQGFQPFQPTFSK